MSNNSIICVCVCVHSYCIKCSSGTGVIAKHTKDRNLGPQGVFILVSTVISNNIISTKSRPFIKYFKAEI